MLWKKALFNSHFPGCKENPDPLVTSRSAGLSRPGRLGTVSSLFKTPDERETIFPYLKRRLSALFPSLSPPPARASLLGVPLLFKGACHLRASAFLGAPCLFVLLFCLCLETCLLASRFRRLSGGRILSTTLAPLPGSHAFRIFSPLVNPRAARVPSFRARLSVSSFTDFPCTPATVVVSRCSSPTGAIAFRGLRTDSELPFLRSLRHACSSYLLR